MGVSRTDIYTESQNGLARLAKCLGHPARIAILQHLFKIKTCVCGELVDEIGLAQATISQHLKELKSVGLIKGVIEGTSVCYCIDIEKWSEVKNLLSEFLNQDIDKETACC